MVYGGSVVRRGIATSIVAFLLTSGVTAALSIPADREDRQHAQAHHTREVVADPVGQAPPVVRGGDAPASAPAPAPAPSPEQPAAPAAPALPVAPLQAAVDGFIAANPGIGSVAVGVALAKPGGAMWLGGNHPQADEPYGILSITKTFTEALVLREAAAGRIDLDAPMPQLPGVVPTPAGVVITPRMLLQHTSGVVNYRSAVGYDRTATVTPQDLVSLSLKSPLLAPPGTKASYSNTNFHWLGLLLEHTTGHTFADLVRGLSLEMSLPHTALEPTGRRGWIGYASGGIRSTVADITRWGAALFTPNRVLGPAQLTELTTLGPQGVSLGLWPIGGGVGQYVAHGGIAYYPGEHIVVVVRIDPPTPQTGGQTAALASALRATVAGSGLPRPAEG